MSLHITMKSYEYILNPVSNRWVATGGKIGQRLLRSYIRQLGGTLSTPSLTKRTSPRIFIINGAPTSQSMDSLRTDHNKHDNLKIVICASLETFQAAQDKIMTPHNLNMVSTGDIYTLPTNFRAPHSMTNGKNPLLHNYGEVHDVPSFKGAQTEVTTALVDILNYADLNKIPTYFAIVPRSDRPTYIQLSKSSGLVEFYDYKGGRNKVLTNLVITNLLDLIFGKDGNPTLEYALSNYTEHNASFLADVLTICCALLLDDEDCWTRHSLGKKENCEVGAVIDYASDFSKKIFTETTEDLHDRREHDSTELRENGYAFCRTRFVPDKNGIFYSFKSGAKNKIEAILTDLAEKFPRGEIEKVWDSCFMVCDTFLNDVDDLPANVLAQALSDEYVEEINYST